MKNKKITMLIIFISIFFICINVIYAAEEATVKIETNSTNLKNGDEIKLKVSVVNASIENGISEVVGTLNFDKTVFELLPIDLEDKIEELELNEEIQELLEESVGMLDVLYLSKDWMISGIGEESEYSIVISAINSEKIINESMTEEIGEINFKVIDSAKNGTAYIKLTNLSVDEEVEISDATTSPITIKTIEPEQIGDGNTLPNGTNLSVGTNKINYSEISNKNNKSKANENLAYTGVEDFFPFIAIIIAIGIVSFINYKKYQGM